MKRLLKSISLFFAIMVLINAFSLVIIQVNYNLNQDYIVKNFCENKDKPMMGCHGQCHLTKQIEKAADERSSESSMPKIRLELNFVSNDFSEVLGANSFVQEISHNTLKFDSFKDFYPSIDKPPC